MSEAEQMGQGTASEPQIILHRDLSTHNQVHTLLSIGSAMMDYLTLEPKEAENIPGAHPLPGESRLAAETTLIKVCNRLDSILDDKTRWGTEYQTALEKLFIEHFRQTRDLAAKRKKLYEAEVRKSEAQRLAALEVQSPHFRYKPTLLELNDGNWAAFLGNVKDTSQGIWGVGRNPAEALQAFDMAFSGGLSEEKRHIVEQRERELNEDDSVDPSRIKAAQDPDGKRDTPPADSGNA